MTSPEPAPSSADSALIPWAYNTAEEALAEALPRRWSHVQGVARRARSLQTVAGADSGLLEAAAVLHDVGYAPGLAETGFHPLDGARALRSWGADEVMCGLVAHHSAAAHEAEVLGLLDELEAFSDPHGLLRDLLWWLDMTTSPDGDVVSFDHRMNEVRNRYPDDHYVIRALDGSMAERRGAVERAEACLSRAGLTGQV